MFEIFGTILRIYKQSETFFFFESNTKNRKKSKSSNMG